MHQDSHSREGEGGRGEGGEDHLGEGAGPCFHGEGEEGRSSMQVEWVKGWRRKS